VTKSKFIGGQKDELTGIAHRIFNKVRVIGCEGLRMLCLRLTLMRDMDSGKVSEPACLIGLDESTLGMKYAKTIGKQ
jgi:hypothetical protein